MKQITPILFIIIAIICAIYILTSIEHHKFAKTLFGAIGFAISAYSAYYTSYRNENGLK